MTRFLSIYALAAFAVAAAALWTFFEFVDEVGEHEWLTQFDESLSAALRDHVSTGTLQAFAMITKLGDPEFLIPFGTFVTVALCAVRLWLHAGVWVVVTSGGALLNQFLKSVFERSRPLHDHGLVSETSWSFPSGHASGSMVVYGLLAYLLVRHTPRAWHLPVTLVAIVLIVFVGSSRVLLQVHYLSDVLAGFASGATWVGLSIAGLEAARGHESKRGL